MFDTSIPSSDRIGLAEYRDSVLGCWSGKNIGGTIGAPLEGSRSMNDVAFYTQALNGEPAPNDDLDLQLIWLITVEQHGPYRITERLLAEYWLNCITGPWNEYGVCKSNMRNGLYPPLSGSCNNDKWKFSNGAWIRAEIWACLFPGSPDEAAYFAAKDACCDHCEEGVYAEMFVAALESAAFVVKEIRRLIEVGLSKIPPGSRITRSILLACNCFDENAGFPDAREAIVRDSADLGWFQAPANLGFVVLALLYGKGDFGRSVALAVNCGDDTDCTAGTVGAVLGILYGRRNIPARWMEPIGETIKTCSISTYDIDGSMGLPHTLAELSARTEAAALRAAAENPALPQLTAGATAFSASSLERFSDNGAIQERIWSQSPYELTFELPFARFSVDFHDDAGFAPGVAKKLTLRLCGVVSPEATAAIRFQLPPGWSISPAPGLRLAGKNPEIMHIDVELTPGEFQDAFEYIPIDIRLGDRCYPTTVQLPAQCAAAAAYNSCWYRGNDFFDELNRRKARRFRDSYQ